MSDRRIIEDRRTCWRLTIPRSVPVRASVARFGGPESGADVVNLSAGGVEIRTQPVLHKGDSVWLRLVGIKSSWIVFGEVRRACPSGEEWLVAIVFDTPLSEEPEIVASLTGNEVGRPSSPPERRPLGKRTPTPRSCSFPGTF